LDPHPVAREKKGLPITIPDREREHAAKALHALGAPGLPRVDDDFRVAARAEYMTERLQLGHEVLEIVDLPVEHHGHRAVLVEQRLLTGGHIDDGKPAVAKPRS